MCIAVVVKYHKLFFYYYFENKLDALLCFSEQLPVQRFCAEILAAAKRDSFMLTSVLASDCIVPLKEEERTTLKAFLSK